MSKWTSVLTDAGENLLAQSVGGNIQITKAESGSGWVDVAQLKTQTGVLNMVKLLLITEIAASENVSEIRLQLNNNGVETSFALKQIGIYAMSESMQEDVLYMIIQITEEDGADIIPSSSKSPNYVCDFLVNLIMGEASSVTGNVNTAAFATVGHALAALNNKVDKVAGKGLSANDYTTAEKNKLAGIAAGAQVNIPVNDQTPTYTESELLATLTSGEKISIAFGKIKKAIYMLISHITNLHNPHDVTKSQVGLENVNNTSDANKPVSTAAQAALDAKIPKADIINNLTSTATDKPPSAAMVKKLNEEKANVSHNHDASDITGGTVTGNVSFEKGSFIKNIGVVGTETGYVKIARISLLQINAGCSLEFYVSQTARDISKITVRLRNYPTLYADIDSFTIEDGYSGTQAYFTSAYLNRVSSTEHDLYVQKSDSNDDISIVDVNFPSNITASSPPKLSVSWLAEFTTTLPEGFVQATRKIPSIAQGGTGATTGVQALQNLYAFGHQGTLSDSQNLNDITVIGLYRCASAPTTAMNYPTTALGMLEVLNPGPTGRCFQRYTELNSPYQTWVRSRIHQTQPWTSWAKYCMVNKIHRKAFTYTDPDGSSTDAASFYTVMGNFGVLWSTAVEIAANATLKVPLARTDIPAGTLLLTGVVNVDPIVFDSTVSNQIYYGGIEIKSGGSTAESIIIVNKDTTKRGMFTWKIMLTFSDAEFIEV
jgi:hypothetical protein